MMDDRRTSSHDDLLEQLRGDPEFEREYRRQKPYYDLLLQVSQRRKQLGLTQADLAALAGTHQSNISRIESGEHDIRLSTLINIAEALEATVDVRLAPVYSFGDEQFRELFSLSADNVSQQTHSSSVTVKEIVGV